jgi:hypothetical protein
MPTTSVPPSHVPTTPSVDPCGAEPVLRSKWYRYELPPAVQASLFGVLLATLSDWKITCMSTLTRSPVPMRSTRHPLSVVQLTALLVIVRGALAEACDSVCAMTELLACTSPSGVLVSGSLMA